MTTLTGCVQTPIKHKNAIISYMKENTLIPMAGQIILKPYIPKETTFVSSKEEAGESQKSEVVAVGEAYKDDHGNIRECPVKVGDVVIHRYAQETFEIDHELYRAVPFYQIIAKIC